MQHNGKTKKKDFTTQELLDAIKDSNGNMSVIAERLNCSWATARQYIGDDAEAKELYKGETERMLDKAEQIINDSLNQTTDHAEQLQTAKWLLATKGGNRGYGTKTKYNNVLHGYRSENDLLDGAFTNYATSVF